MKQNNVPDAELFIASGCAHCPAALAALSEFIKQGKIARLDIINITTKPDIAAARGVRSVPWLNIGPFELLGAHSRSELATWIERAGAPEGRQDYLKELLTDGELERATAICRRDTQFLPALFALSADLDTPFAARIGVGAILEELGPEGLLHEFVETIAVLMIDSSETQIRADGAHFLGLTGSVDAIAYLQRLSDDDDSQVREIANEALQQLAIETSE